MRSEVLYSFFQPAVHGEVDPLVLASLPPSMQLDLLVQVEFLKVFFSSSASYILFCHE